MVAPIRASAAVPISQTAPSGQTATRPPDVLPITSCQTETESPNRTRNSDRTRGVVSSVRQILSRTAALNPPELLSFTTAFVVDHSCHVWPSVSILYISGCTNVHLDVLIWSPPLWGAPPPRPERRMEGAVKTLLYVLLLFLSLRLFPHFRSFPFRACARSARRRDSFLLVAGAELD